MPNIEVTTSPKQSPIVMLTSGVTLGVYLPALLLRLRFEGLGQKSRIDVLENLYDPAQKKRLLENKKAFHANFRIALMGQRLASNVVSRFCEKTVEVLFASWEAQECRYFDVFSGFWMPLLREYAHRTKNGPLHIDRCHMDAKVSVSWQKLIQEIAPSNHDLLRERDVWFFSHDHSKMHEIRVPDVDVVPFDERDHRLVMHGGGWGIGTYMQRKADLPDMGMSIDIVVENLEEEDTLDNVCNLMIRPNWNPWNCNEAGEHTFPPMGQVLDGNYQEFEEAGEHHALLLRKQKAKAIVSKPGGMTMVDSLATATPLIHLTPFGDYEAENAKLWEDLGFGMSFDDWVESSAPEAELRSMHLNLLKQRHQFIDYGGRHQS